ncbi:polysaccharide biosynthesis tyrosine autokinase [Brumimicrobium glaciale]|uniref:non-specific protein-tyrosine kinase n=1 Tax=Brumimicrobium glaciale TaxID=200475 RepID=A0A4Q4KU94_9FLAO|nr:tyrosine-protein kinase [Brumimicrobium glaciale]RYM35694.1 polysaccharide biosynthesis tyrosine autokinase [Brumimicrobium glaciale]
MNSQKGKIFVNTTFDLKVLKIVIKRNWYWCAIISILFFVFAFIYVRYTKPVYESKMLIQLNSENQGADLLDFKDARKDGSIAKEIELLRSQLLFEKAIDDLPLNVSLYARGEFLTETLYKQGTIRIKPLIIKDSSLFGTPIFLSAFDDKVIMNFKYNGGNYNYKFSPNSLLKTPFFDMRVSIDNWDQYLANTTSNKLYFVLNEKKSIARQLRSGLTVTPVDPNARTVELSFRSHSPTLAMEIVQSLTANFFKYDENIKKESADNILDFIAVQLDSLTQELKVAKDSIMAYQRQENITNPEFIASTTSQKIEILKLEERNGLEELRILNSVESKLKGNPNSLDVYRLIPVIIGKSYESSLSIQIQELYNLIEQKEDLLYQVTPENENIKKLIMRIQVRKENIDEIIALLSSRIQERLIVIRKELAEYEDSYLKLPEKQMELSRLNNVKELNEKYFSLLTDKRAIYSISNAGYSSDNKVLNDASTSGTPVFPKVEMIYAVSLFLAFSLSMAFLFLRYLLFNEINQLSDLRSIIPSKIGVLGSIPKNKNKDTYSLLVVDNNPRSMISESFRALRTNLSFVKNDIRTITITSTVSGEGKTFVVLNLAGIIAMTGKKVLVVDLDMRRPTVHHGLGATNEKGMSNLLARLCEKEDVIQNTRIENLDFISAGPIPPNPSELLLGKRLDELIIEFKDVYDVIIFDNPPIGLVSDGVRLLTKVDVPIYVFRSNYSKRNYSDKLHEISEIEEMKNINVVLNAVDAKKSLYGYGYGNYYNEE